MLDRLGNEVDFTELFMEETLTTKDKKELPDSMYGLVYADEKGNKVRKFPLNDESHVRQAAIFFDRAKDLTEDQKRELARNIVRRAKELDMDYSGWESLKPYLDKPVKESFSTFEQNGFDDLFGYILETYKPYDEYLKLHQYDSKTNTTQQQTTNNTSPPPIQESFNEMFGEKVSLKNMYQESSTDMMKVDDLECDELYFGSDTKYPVEIDLNRPLFVTPLKGIASIFVGRADLNGIIPKGSYNLDYKEWRLPDKELMKPLKTVHVYVEGYPDLKEQEITLKGYIHCIPFKYYKDNIYRYPWMSKGVEYLIANTENMKVEFTRIIECEVKYIVKGVPSDNPKYGPDLKGYLELAKHIAKKISIQVKNDSKPPTGNQNCQLCTWCAEAQFRGMKVLPRPVYSPRDPVFKIVGENIVHQPRCISLKQGYDDFLDHLMDVDTTFARWYCHVNWKGSTGGHEFMLLKIDKKFYIMDPQSGKVETLDDTHKYFEDINWDNSYICRFDNKAFNHELLEKTNDPKKTLPWDPKKDIPYMVKHGMCTKEEAEKELKKMETNLFTSELKKALNQTHIQESASDQTPIQEGLFSNSKEHIPTISDNFEEFTRAYNDPIFKSIIEDFKNMKSKDLKKYYDNRFPVNERDDWMKDNFDGTVVSFEKNIDSDLVETDNRYNPIGYMFATVKNQDEWLSISMLDGCVYYCNIRDNSKVSSSFNEFLKSFNGVFDKYLKDSHIQESASDPMTIIPKDLRDWLKKGDYSSLEKDDAYYYVEGHPVEEFWRDPEFARSAFYLDDKNDPSYNSIVFSDDNGNGLIYDPTDGWYYYLYHDWTEDDTGFLHRERLSSKSWTQIIDPTHSKSIKDSDEKRSEISKELTHLKGNPIYDDIEYGATNSHFGKGFFKSDCSAMEKRWNAIGHEWCNAVEDFADKYKFPELSEAIDIFANKTMSLFVPTIGSHGYDIEAYKEGAKNVIKAFQDVEKSLKDSHIQEGAWNDIRNGVNPWSDKLIFHISPQGYLDGQVFKPRVPEYLDKYDPSQTNFEDVDNPRICFSTSIEGALNAILVNIGRWKTAEKLNNWYVYIPEKPLKDYKHSTNKNIIEDKKVFDANLTKEIWIEEPVRLKQYGIIRIDQVKSVARRKTVPTINGEKGDRNYYSFKWHWLVRPSVLKNIPYDYSPIAVCNNMLDDISKYKYGLGMNGSTHSVSSKEYNEKYRLESPEEFEKNGGGICYDFVEWQAGYLDAYGYTCRKFYISTDTEDMDTHTFILVDDGKGGFIYPEAAFKPMEGVYVVKSPEEAVLKVMGHIFDINDNDEKYDEIKYYVWEYKDHPAYGSTIKECMEYFSKGEPFYEGIAKNKKE